MLSNDYLAATHESRHSEKSVVTTQDGSRFCFQVIYSRFRNEIGECSCSCTVQINNLDFELYLYYRVKRVVYNVIK